MSGYRILKGTAPQASQFYLGNDTGTLFLRLRSDTYTVVSGYGIFAGKEGHVFSIAHLNAGNGIHRLATETVIELTL